MEAIFRPGLTRVVLTGSESTGKTELATGLARHFGVAFVPEFVRDYAVQKGAPLDFSDHGPIAEGQMALENAYAARADDLLIQDTDLLSTIVYCRHYFGRAPDWIVERARERRPSRYLLMDIDSPWVPDAVRDRGTPEQRREMHALFETAVRESGVAYDIISGSAAERFERAVRAVAAARG